MASCLQKIPSEWILCAEGENDEMGIPNYREKIAIEYDAVLHLVNENTLNSKTMFCRGKNIFFGYQQIFHDHI